MGKPLEEQIGEWMNTPLLYEFKKQYMNKISSYLRVQRMSKTILPASDNVFKAYRLTPLDDIKVVILGQDPYPHKAANGLAFSCEDSLEDTPKSLKNIFKEIEDDLDIFRPYHDPDLTRWAKQGVFLLNTCLTVREGHPGSHYSLGWQRFTRKTIDLIIKKEDPVVFLLWGRQAQYYGVDIPEPHKVIYSSHPSPHSAHKGFFGTKPFSRANEFLENNNYEPINWIEQ